MTIRHLVCIGLAGLSLACSAPRRGVLEPVADQGIALVSTHGLPNDTARLTAGGVTADVTGRWSEQGESIEVRYRASRAETVIATRSSSAWKGRTVPATAAWDRSKPEPGNAIGRSLAQDAPLRLVPNTVPVIQIMFDRPAGTDGPSIGDRVTIAIPMPDHAHPVPFRVSGE